MFTSLNRLPVRSSVSGAALVVAIALGGCGHKSSSTPTLAYISIAPVTATVQVGATQQLTVTGNYTNNTTVNLTTTATYVSSGAAATVNAAGLVTGVSAGTAVITATDTTAQATNGTTATVSIIVIAATPAATPAEPTAKTTAFGRPQAALAAATRTGVTAAGTRCCSSRYELMSSDYSRYATAPSAHGAYLHSRQGGDVVAIATAGFTYSYDSPQSAIASTGYYAYEAQAGAGYAPRSDAFGLVFHAPTDAAGTVEPMLIAPSASLLIRMGRSTALRTAGGHADVYTVTLADALGATGAGGDSCAADVALADAATDTADGLADYVVPLSSFACATGSLAHLGASGVSRVTVEVLGSRNPLIVAGERDVIAVGSIGFTR